MPPGFFSTLIEHPRNPVLDISGGERRRALIISDLHMGDGKRDDLAVNGRLLLNALEQYYWPGGWHLILNGDIEEAAKYRLRDIRAQWCALYRVFDRFHGAGRLHKLLGNHDESLLLEKDYPYPLHHALRIETGVIPAYIYHGHQSSRAYTDYNNLLSLGLRYFLKPFGIRNISTARNPRRRFFVEKEAYRFSLEHNCISVIGHTHRALFESLGRFEYIKYEIERLCRDYPHADAGEKERIFAEVSSLRRELGKLKRKEKRDALRQSLYGDDLPVPCLFNAGSAIGKKGIHCIELDRETIALVYWFYQGRGMRFITRGWYTVEPLGNTGCCRSTLNQDRLDYIKARIELLGKAAPEWEGEKGR
ncbi:MAG: serine/threonine protein phosphatase [Treponematales bacterium]